MEKKLIPPPPKPQKLLPEDFRISGPFRAKAGHHMNILSMDTGVLYISQVGCWYFIIRVKGLAYFIARIHPKEAFLALAERIKTEMEKTK